MAARKKGALAMVVEESLQLARFLAGLDPHQVGCTGHLDHSVCRSFRHAMDSPQLVRLLTDCKAVQVLRWQGTEEQEPRVYTLNAVDGLAGPSLHQ